MALEPMRLTSIVLPIVVLLAIVGAFAAGHYIGKRDAMQVAVEAARNLDAGRSAEIVFVATTARQALRNGNAAEADALLLRYAALKAEPLAECSASASCVASVGKFMPSKAELDALAAAELSLRGK